MQTYKTCEISDEYKHVCFKDLENYITVDNFIDVLRGYSDIELEQIRKELNIPIAIKVDEELNIYSTNPVQNSTLTQVLYKKADIDKLATVSLTGNYEDLNNLPCKLPNPEPLIIKGEGNPRLYDGTHGEIIKLPTSIKDLDDWEQYIVDYDKISSLIKIKTIEVNNVVIAPDDCGTVNINVITKNDVKTLLKDYASIGYVDSEINQLNQTLLSKIEVLENTITNLTNRVTNIENNCCGGEYLNLGYTAEHAKYNESDLTYTIAPDGKSATSGDTKYLAEVDENGDIIIHVSSNTNWTIN